MENIDRTKIKREIRQRRNQRFYEKRKGDRIFCECCVRFIDKYYWKTHIQTALHKHCEEIFHEQKKQ